MGMQWLEKDTRSCLLMFMSQKKPKNRLSTVLYLLVCTPFLAGIDLNVIFPLHSCDIWELFWACMSFLFELQLHSSFSFRFSSTSELLHYDNGTRNVYHLQCSLSISHHSQ